MCGIFGVGFDSNQKSLDDLVAILSHGTSALASRGPEGQNIWVNTGQNGGLGHRQLPFLKTQLPQPHHGTNGARWVGVVNGELYDYDAWRSRLHAQGVEAPEGDCGILLAALNHWGVDILSEMSFEGAGILWQEADHESDESVLMFRDRFGIKPLVWALHPSGWVAGSEAKALFASGIVTARWDKKSLGQVLDQQYLTPTKTLFDGVNKIPPGGWVLLSHQPKWSVSASIRFSVV